MLEVKGQLNALGIAQQIKTSGGSGSDVTVTQVLESGTKIATITVDDTPTDLYAPTPEEPTVVEVTQVLSTGTKIATITVNDTPTDIYAPSASTSEYVEVTGDGAKTYSQLLDALYALIDSSKITHNAKIVSGKLIYILTGNDSNNSYDFFSNYIYNGTLDCNNYTLKSSGSTNYETVLSSSTTINNFSSSVVPSGTTIRLYY